MLRPVPLRPAATPAQPPRPAALVDTRLCHLPPTPPPLVLFSLCAGLMPELEQLLRCGYCIRSAFALDTDTELRLVWHTTLARLRRQYPRQLHPQFDIAHDVQFPLDVRDFAAEQLRPLLPVVGADAHVLVVAGWECRPRSHAGRGRGAADPRAASFDGVAHFVAAAQAAWPQRVSYILENVRVDARSTAAVHADERIVRATFGDPFVFDAVAVGSAARRIRAYWTNLFPPDQWTIWLAGQRPPPLALASCLDAGHLPRLATAVDVQRHPDRNVLGLPLVVAPTIISSSSAWASPSELPPVALSFGHRHLTAAERERALGHSPGSSLPGTEAQRCRWLGQAFDARALHALLLFATHGHGAMLGPQPPGGESGPGAPFFAMAAPTHHFRSPSAAALNAAMMPDRIGCLPQSPPPRPGLSLPSSIYTLLLYSAPSKGAGQLGPAEVPFLSLRATVPRNSSGTYARVPVMTIHTHDGRALGGYLNEEDHPMVTFLRDSLEAAFELPPTTAPSEPVKHDINPAMGPANVAKFLAFLREMEREGLGATHVGALGRFKGAPFTFKLTTSDVSSAYTRRRVLPPIHAAALAEEVKMLQDAGLIEDSTSSVASNPVVVTKKDGTARVCIDFQPVNALTEADRLSLPFINEVFARLLGEVGANIFSTMDLARGFNQIPIDPEHRYLTAFHTASGLKQYTVMPFGVRNGTAAFQRRMEETIGHLPFAVAFVDDLTNATNIPDLKFCDSPVQPLDEQGYASGPIQLVPTGTDWDIQPHLDQLAKLFAALKAKGWTLKWSKCTWGYFAISLLGHYVSSHGVQPTEDKVRAILTLPRPNSIKSIKRYLGMIGYYRDHLPHFATIAAPITMLQREGVKLEWGDEQEAARLQLNSLISTAPILRAPRKDLPIYLTTDWSCQGMGAMLEQVYEDGKRYVIAYCSRTCSDAEGKYGSFKGEAATLAFAVHHWRYLLINGHKNIYRTDNSALRWLMSGLNLPPMAARWALQLAEFDFEVQHIAGKDNVVCDFLSRPDAEGPPAKTVPWPASVAEADEQIRLAFPPPEPVGLSVPSVPLTLLRPALFSSSPMSRPLGLGPLSSDCALLNRMMRDAAEALLCRELLLARLEAREEDPVCLSSLVAALYWPPPPPLAPPTPVSFSSLSTTSAPLSVPTCVLVPEQPGQATPSSEIWLDGNTMAYLRALAARRGQPAAGHPGPPPDSVLAACSAAERYRVRGRAARFFVEAYADGSEKLIYLVSPGTGLECPPPGDRDALIERLHSARTGLNHLGAGRTYDRLSRTHWWRGIVQDVYRVVAACRVCDMQKARPLPPTAQLQSLPIVPLFYRLHSDLCGPFPASKQGGVYVMVMVDAFSGALFLEALPDKRAVTTARAGQRLIAFIGAPIDWVTDGGGEWEAEFADMLLQNKVNHRTTSPYHPQSNGRAERSVQVVKRLLTRLLAENKPEEDFEDLLPGIMLAYNCSRHKATGVSPYLVMYGRDVLVPAQARAVMHEELDLDDPALLQRHLLRRAEILRHAVPTAASNRVEAQRTDALAYARRRSGNYHPHMRRDIRVGDPVYLNRRTGQGLELAVRPHILQVVVVKPSGVLRLQGKEGRCINEHRTNVAPCNLVDLDLTVNPALARPALSTACEICEEDDPVGRNIVLCSMCSSGWHWPCLLRQKMVIGRRPPPSELAWYCSYCRDFRRLPVPVTADGVQTSSPSAVSLMSISVVNVSSPHLLPSPLQPQLPLDFCDPSQWRLRSVEALAALLSQEMPGPWPASHLTKLFRQLPGTHLDPALLRLFSPTKAAEYEPLVDALKWEQISTVWDPWCGSGSTRAAVPADTCVFLSDIVRRRDAHVHALANAVEPSDLLSVSERHGPFSGIVASPWFALLDLAVCAALTQPVDFVAFHVPCHYIASATPPRAEFFQRMSEEGRLLLIMNLPRSSYGRRCAWMVVFKTTALRDRLVSRSITAKCHAWTVLARLGSAAPDSF